MSDNINVEVKRKNPSIPPKNLRQLTKQVAEIEGTIDGINESVEEAEQDVNEIKRAIDNSDDFVIRNNKMKRKNKAYNPVQYSGLGEIYLEKNNTFLGREFDEFVVNVDIPDLTAIAETFDGLVYDRHRKEFLVYELVDGERVYYAEWIKFDKWESTDDYVPEAGYDFICEADDKAYRWTEETTPDLIETEAHYGNVLKQEMVNISNTIYHIQYDYDLNGRTIELLEGCVLKFDGGSLRNGAITGQGTDIIADSSKEIFSNISIDGSWITKDVYVEWMHIDNTEEVGTAVRNIAMLLNSDIQQNFYFPNYPIAFTPTVEHSTLFASSASNTNIHIPSTITVNGNDLEKYTVIGISWCKNVTIDGGGKIIGDVGNRSYPRPPEGGYDFYQYGMGISIYRAHYITVRNLNISKCMGDGIYTWGAAESSFGNYNNGCTHILIEDVELLYNRRQGISVCSATNFMTIKNCNISYTGRIESTYPTCGIDFEPNEGATEKYDNIVIENSTFIGNLNIGIKFDCAARVNDVINVHGSCTISNCDLGFTPYLFDETNTLPLVSSGINVAGLFNKMEIKDSKIGAVHPGNSIALTETPGNVIFDNCTIQRVLQYVNRNNLQSMNILTFKDSEFVLKNYSVSKYAGFGLIDLSMYTKLNFINCVVDYSGNKEIHSNNNMNMFAYAINTKASLYFEKCDIKTQIITLIPMDYIGCKFLGYVAAYIRKYGITRWENNVIDARNAEYVFRIIGAIDSEMSSDSSNPTKMIINGNNVLGSPDVLFRTPYSNPSASLDMHNNILSDKYNTKAYMQEIVGSFNQTVDIKNAYRQDIPYRVGTSLTNLWFTPKANDVIYINGKQYIHNGTDFIKTVGEDNKEWLVNNVDNINSGDSFYIGDLGGYYKVAEIIGVGVEIDFFENSRDSFTSATVIVPSTEPNISSKAYLILKGTKDEIDSNKRFTNPKIIDGYLYLQYRSGQSYTRLRRMIKHTYAFQPMMEYIGDTLPTGTERTVILLKESSTTTYRQGLTDVPDGFEFYDVDLHKWLHAEKSNSIITWYDATGTVVS